MLLFGYSGSTLSYQASSQANHFLELQLAGGNQLADFTKSVRKQP